MPVHHISAGLDPTDRICSKYGATLIQAAFIWKITQALEAP